MKRLVQFFEIPAADFSRAIQFYETVLGTKLMVMDCGHEKMAFISDDSGEYCGAISWAENFRPSPDGVMISLFTNNMEHTLSAVEANGGKVLTPKTKIEADNMGYFAVFIDSEGNRLGFYSDN